MPKNHEEMKLKAVNLNLKSLEKNLLKSLIPKDLNDHKNSIGYRDIK